MVGHKIVIFCIACMKRLEKIHMNNFRLQNAKGEKQYEGDFLVKSSKMLIMIRNVFDYRVLF